MKSQKLGDKIYLRLDKGDEVLKSVLQTARDQKISSATFSGIGACAKVVIGTYLPEKQDFLLHTKEGMLEMISLMGNVTQDADHAKLNIHAHGMFSYLDAKTNTIQYFGGDLKSARIMYTGEIVIEPVIGGEISKQFDPNVGIDVWHFEKELE